MWSSVENVLQSLNPLTASYGYIARGIQPFQVCVTCWTHKVSTISHERKCSRVTAIQLFRVWLRMCIVQLPFIDRHTVYFKSSISTSCKSFLSYLGSKKHGLFVELGYDMKFGSNFLTALCIIVQIRFLPFILHGCKVLFLQVKGHSWTQLNVTCISVRDSFGGRSRS